MIEKNHLEEFEKHRIVFNILLFCVLIESVLVVFLTIKLTEVQENYNVLFEVQTNTRDLYIKAKEDLNDTLAVCGPGWIEGDITDAERNLIGDK